MAVVFRTPLHEVARWPNGEVELLEAFLAQEPAADARVEIVIAQLCSLFASVNSSGKTAPPKLHDFLLFRNAWKTQEATIDMTRYSDADRSVLDALGGVRS